VKSIFKMRIGLLCALPDEFIPVEHLTETSSTTLAEKKFTHYSYAHHEHANHEHANHEHANHELVFAQGGVGKVNAALTATVLIQHFQCDVLFCVGISGALDPELQLGDILIAEKLYQHDYGSLIEGAFFPSRSGSHPVKKTKFPKPFRLSKTLLQQIQKLELDVHWGTVISGDVFVTGTVAEVSFSKFEAQAVDMESASVAQVAECFHCPFIAIRCISDHVSESQKQLKHTVSVPHSAMKQLYSVAFQIIESFKRT